MKQKLSYKNAGVDIIAGNQLIDNIKPFVKKTIRKEVLSDLGGFGALFEISKKYKNPVLVSGTDGVGTKLKLACEWNMHDDIGTDLVAMCVNDILVQGAEPLFFLDYYACNNLNINIATKVIKSIANACCLAGCSLIGGETAEMPSMYHVDEYDLAGFAVGVVEKHLIISGKNIHINDDIIAISSSGAHSNGYALIRKILEISNVNLDSHFYNDKSFKQIIMEPTKIYVKTILNLINHFEIKAMAHITGGGLIENIPRILPDNVTAYIDTQLWQWPLLFKWIQKNGNIDDKEMYTTFNCGIGFILIVNNKDSDKIIEFLNTNGENSFKIGEIIQKNSRAHKIQIK